MTRQNENPPQIFPMSAASELLCLLNLANLSPTERRRAQLLAQRNNSDEFLQLAELNSVLPWTLRTAKSLNLELLPDSAVAKVNELRSNGLRRAQYLEKVLQWAESVGIEVILLKGAALAASVYGDLAYKKMNDADILIRFEDAQTFCQGLRQLGFSCVGPLLEKTEISNRSHHAPPFVSEDLSCVVGVHWGLCSPHSKWTPSLEVVWRDKVRIQYGQTQAWRMSWEDYLLHLCTHLPFFKVGLRELADVFNLIRAAGPNLSWARLEQMMHAWHAHEGIYRVLRLSGALSNVNVPDNIFSSARRNCRRWIINDTDMRAHAPNMLLRSRSVHLGKIEKAFAVFRLSACYRERMQAWWNTWSLTIWPPVVELEKVLAREVHGGFNLMTARLRAPRMLFRVLVRDHGMIPILAITAINIASVIRQTVSRPFRKDGESLCRGHAGRLLEMLE